MKKNILIATITLGILSVPFAMVRAEETTVALTPTVTETESTPAPTTTTLPRNPVLDKLKMQAQERRDKLNNDDQKAMGEEKKLLLGERRTLTEEERKTTREEFMTKLQALKNKKTQTLIERIDEKINNLNERHTQRLEKFLGNISAVLDRIKVRMEKADEKGIEVQSVQEKVDAAEKAIADAQTALDGQKLIDYTAELPEAGEVKGVIKALFEDFRADIKAVHESVKTAHAAVRDAARVLGQLHKENPKLDEENDSEDKLTPTVSVTLKPTETPEPTEMP